jgi:hypothetical protein
MSSRQQKAGLALSVLLALFLIVVSASGKLVGFEGADAMFAHLGWTKSAMKVVGVVEVIVTLLTLIPQSAFIGTILLTAYLGGATATHARVGDPWFFPVILGVLAWVAYGLRFPDRLRPALGLRA